MSRPSSSLRNAATEQLLAEGLHPFGEIREPNGRVPKCFARGEWKVFLNALEDIQGAIAYVEENPIKEGKPRQRWTFVRPFDPTLSDAYFER